MLTLPPGSADASTAGYAPEPAGWRPDVLEKPLDKVDHLRMLSDLNGEVCEVVTGVTLVYPVLQAPGYQIVYVCRQSILDGSDVRKGPSTSGHACILSTTKSVCWRRT